MNDSCREWRYPVKSNIELSLRICHNIFDLVGDRVSAINIESLFRAWKIWNLCSSDINYYQYDVELSYIK